MTLCHGQVFKAILTIFLFPISYCFGATIYVNVNNPTPGTGTSWASAYNDLNAALVAAESGPFSNTLWVAQGTYKPTTTTDRTVTFYLTGAVLVYGGFNGTETALGQQDPVANPTILSGDIGIAGDISDNSYHVVTCENYNSGTFLNGFTIEYGNANADYPASTTPQADNTGGGVLLLAKPNDNSVGWIQYCTFTNNFAVYGGGYGAYGDGTGTTGGNTFSAYKVNNCYFNNNSAVMGGAFGVVGTNQVWSMGTIQNCIFTNNSSTAGEGSVIASIGNNAYSNVTNNFNNSDLYNNPQPIAYSQCTSTTTGRSYIWMTNDIVWQAGAPYAGPLTAGPNNTDINFTNCDLGLSTPLGDNLDADPQFVDAAGGNFHVAHCTSPVIDQGWPVGNMVSYDMDNNPRVQGSAIDIGAYEQAHPVAPTVSNPSIPYCLNATASALTATPTSGNTLLWYTIATGGTGSATAPTPPTSTAITEYYYVSQVDATGCEGPRTPISVTISAGAAQPTANPIPPYCQNTTATQLNVTGANLLWYTAPTGGTGSSTAPTPSTASNGTTAYYVTQTPTGSCESNRLEIDVTVSLPPSAPTANPIPPYCQNTTAATLTATGTNLLWYTTATGGTGAPTAPTPSTAATGSTTWYVTQTSSGCESPRTPVTVTISQSPAGPTYTPVGPYCENTTAPQLTATGTNLLWYTTAAGGTGDPTAPTPSTTITGSTTWYVTQTVGTCESPRTAVTVTINAIPEISIDPVTGSVCAGGTVKLEATGADTYQWSPTTGLSDPSTSNPVALLQKDILYTVTGTTAGCSATAQLTLTVGAACMGYYIPNAFSPNGDGANDLFRVKTADVPRSFSMIVFNRYGGKIFESADIATGWNGAIGGNLAPTGAYVYTVVLTTSAGDIIKRQGTVILVR